MEAVKTIAPSEPKNPRFSLDYMDRTADPTKEFYKYATGSWLRANQIPPEKSRWTAFDEVFERNLFLIKKILEDCAQNQDAKPGTPERLVGDFYKAAMDTKSIDKLGLFPIKDILLDLQNIRSPEDVSPFLARLHTLGISAFISSYSWADKKDSSVYAFYLEQGGLSLPDREYYISDSFSQIREAYLSHIARVFQVAGDSEAEGKKQAIVVVEIETELAKQSRSRADLRDEEKNYNRLSFRELDTRFSTFQTKRYLYSHGVPEVGYVVVGQPEFLDASDALLKQRPVEETKTYLRWHILHGFAPHLQSVLVDEDFEFFHKILLGQKEPEPRWKRAAKAIDLLLGEALGKLFVEKHFPPEARGRAARLIDDLAEVFRERLRRISWMTEATRREALLKFEKFIVKIGHPEKFRDYSSVLIDPSDHLGNVRRAYTFEANRQGVRVGKPVDKSEWHMTPQTVDAYNNSTENEIVFPAGILQPPYLDPSLDDAVNYGAIGTVIGHEITHGYDDQGRKYDSQGNLRDWWTKEDESNFNGKARKVVELYSSIEILPGLRVNGELTLGENIADLGGVSLAYEALQKRLSKDSSRRAKIDGLTPEQRFFISWAQIWRENIREEEVRRQITLNPHSPSQFRGLLPALNHPGFDLAFPSETRDPRNQHVGVW